MSKFKVGDMVRRTAYSTSGLTKGCLYEVVKLDGDWITVISDDDEHQNGANVNFELVTTEDQQQQHNPVSKPSHYNVADGIECITYIKQVLGNEGFVAYCRGNQIKYQHRAMYKGNPIEDLEKAHQYNAWAIETLKELPDE